MDIKQNDIVEFRGNPCRVMYISHEDNDLQISPYGWVPQSNVKLLESTHIPTLNVGDEVVIHEIDDGDRKYYSADWVDGMDELIGTTSTIVNIDIREGTCRLENSYWFASYHLEKIDDYDII